MKKPIVEIVHRKSGIIPFLLEENELIAQKNNKLITYNILSEKIKLLATLPGSTVEKLSRLSAYSMNAMRTRVNWVCRSNSGDILVCTRSGVYRLVSGRLLEELIFEDRKYFLDAHVSSGIDGFEDGIYVGEYFSNNKKDRVAVWHRSEQGEWKQVFVFGEGIINHVHAIVPDNAENCQWVLTGDFESGPAFWRARNGYATVDLASPVEQNYRACWLFDCGESVYWATDTQLTENSLFRALKSDVGKKSKIIGLPGSSIYGARVGRHFVFSTTLEPERAERGKLGIWFDTKAAAALRPDGAALFVMDNDGEVSELIACPSNGWPLRIFEYPTFLLAKCHSQNSFFCAYGRSVRGYNHQLIVCKIAA